MVVSHLLSPLRTLKTKARAVGKSSSGSIDGWSDGPDDDGGGNGPAGGGTDEAAPGQCMAVGLCLCCGSKVSYPDTVACFRCTVCDTINDLKELVRTEKVVEDGRLVSRPRRPPPPLTLGRLRAGVQAYKKHPEKHSLLEAMIYESFGSWDVLNVSFPSGTDMSADDPAIAFAEVHSAYKTILALPPPFIRAMMSGIEQVLRRPGRPLKAREDIRYLVIIME
ncbi:putative E3 ubiquitin-protein ligase, partial [Coemansia biformis]